MEVDIRLAAVIGVERIERSIHLLLQLDHQITVCACIGRVAFQQLRKRFVLHILRLPVVRIHQIRIQKTAGYGAHVVAARFIFLQKQLTRFHHDGNAQHNRYNQKENV